MADATTGTDLIRAALKVRAFKGDLALIARDLNVPIGQLDSFIAGRLIPSPALLRDLTGMLYLHAEYDEHLDLLRAKNSGAEVQPLGQAPPRCERRETPGAGGLPPRGPQPVVEVAQKRPQRRAGWLDGW